MYLKVPRTATGTQTAPVVSSEAAATSVPASRGLHSLANLAAPGEGIVQRRLFVRKVDFNPDVAAQELAREPADRDPNAGFTDWEFTVANIRDALRDYFRDGGAALDYPGGNTPVSNVYRNGLRQKLAALGDVDLEAKDVPTLARVVAAYLIGDVGIAVGEQNRIETAVEAALAANSFRLPGNAANTKGGLFDRLIIAARANGSVSMAKGTPNQLPPANIPGGLGAHVVTALDHLREANAAILNFTAAAEFDETLELPDLLATAIPAVDGRSPHHNRAGWLPSVVVPQLLQPFYASFTGTHRSTERLIAEGKGADLHAGRLATRAQKIRSTFNAAGGNREKLMLIWSNYAMRASGTAFPYIEFNGPGLLSRIVYDYVNGRFYATLHYGWHGGYNAFFEMTGQADL